MSKLTWHFQYLGTAVDAIAAAAAARYVKVMDPPSNNPFPRQQVIGRTYLDDNASNALVAQGAAGAQQWFDRFLPVYNSRPYVTWWEGPNEPQNIYDPAFRTALVAFTLRLTELLRSIGKKCVALNLSVGAPDILEFMDFRGLAGKVDAIGLHEYSAPSMQSGEGWYCLRYRKYKAAWAAAGLWWPATFITECGIDGGVLSPPRPRTGWKSYTDRAGYMGQLKWYDAELAKDPEVLAATIFTSGPNNDWRDFDFDAELSRDLAAHIASAPPPPPATLTLPDRLAAAFGAQFTDLRASLVTSTPPYTRRSLSAVRRAILHHTAAGDVVDWPEVAEYHVYSRGWPGIAYHIGLHQDGRVALLNDLETISYHSGTANNDSYAICVAGNFENDPVSDALWQRIQAVKQVVDDHLERAVTMIGHRDIMQTACPGAHLYACLTAPPPEVPVTIKLGSYVDDFNLQIVPFEQRPDVASWTTGPYYRITQVFTTRDGSWDVSNNPGSIDQWARDAWHTGADWKGAGGTNNFFIKVLDKTGAPLVNKGLYYWQGPMTADPSKLMNVNQKTTWQSGDENLPVWDSYAPDRDEHGKWGGSTVGRSDVLMGVDLPYNWHVSTFVVMQETDAAPVTPPTGNLEADIIDMCWNNLYPSGGVPHNPTFAFPKEAARLALGTPTTLELSDITGYVAQGFALGILYCKTGDWGNIVRLAW